MRKAHLRIKLTDPTFISALENGSPYLDNTAFNSVFKGLYITNVDSSITGTSIPSGTGAIVSFNMNSALSTVTVYYHNATSDSLQESFKINAETVKYSRFAHNYAGTDVIKHISPVSPTLDTTVTYVSAMAGVKTKIMIPNIKELKNYGDVVINKAQIVFTIENNSEGNFDYPLNAMSLVGIDASGASVFLPDAYEGSDYYGGGIVSNGSVKTYTFNISRHVHQLVYGTSTDYGMYLIANGASITSNRAVLGSEKNTISKIRLEITYSKL